MLVSLLLLRSFISMLLYHVDIIILIAVILIVVIILFYYSFNYFLSWLMYVDFVLSVAALSLFSAKEG